MSGALRGLSKAVPALPRAPNVARHIPGGGGGGGGGGGAGGGWKPPSGGTPTGGGNNPLKVRMDVMKIPEPKNIPVSMKAKIGDKAPCLVAFVLALKKVTDDMEEIAKDDDTPDGVKAKLAVAQKKNVEKAVKDFKDCLTSGVGGVSLTGAALTMATDKAEAIAMGHLEGINETAAMLIKSAKRVSTAEE